MNTVGNLTLNYYLKILFNTLLQAVNERNINTFTSIVKMHEIEVCPHPCHTTPTNKQRMAVCVCVCVCERERERER